MKKTKHKILTFTALMAMATGAVHIINRFISTSSQLKEILDTSSKKYYDWNLGQVYYTKKGTGTPLLLIHDMLPGASGYEWSRVEDKLASQYTVYTIDLLGCGRSDKPGITYTNFVYVQLICDFIKNVIGEETNIIASGFSGSFVTMACLYDNTLINKIMLVNPPALVSTAQEPTEKDKILYYLLQIPVFGTLIYHIAVSRETSSSLFLEKLYYNPFHADQDVMDAYYEAAHRGGYYTKYLYACIVAKYMNVNLENALKTIDNCIYVISGSEEANGEHIAAEYQNLNSSIETCVIKKAKHLPHIEASGDFLEQVGIFF